LPALAEHTFFAPWREKLLSLAQLADRQTILVKQSLKSIADSTDQGGGKRRADDMETKLKSSLLGHV
jgi:hypothetical protein